MRKLLVFVLVMIAGCDSSGTDRDAQTGRYVLSGTYAYEFTLRDGTRCVTTQDGGMDCDWSTGHAEQSTSSH